MVSYKGISLEDRFWSKADKTGECWNWLYSKNEYGYGHFYYNGKTFTASRLAWKLTNGEIPLGLEVCHICDNPACVRPQHLYLGTHKENMRESFRKKRSRIPGLKGEAHYKTKLTLEQVEEIRSECTKGVQQKFFALKYDLSPSAICSIVRERNWKTKVVGV